MVFPKFTVQIIDDCAIFIHSLPIFHPIPPILPPNSNSTETLPALSSRSGDGAIGRWELEALDAPEA